MSRALAALVAAAIALTSTPALADRERPERDHPPPCKCKRKQPPAFEVAADGGDAVFAHTVARSADITTALQCLGASGASQARVEVRFRRGAHPPRVRWQHAGKAAACLRKIRWDHLPQAPRRLRISLVPRDAHY